MVEDDVQVWADGLTERADFKDGAGTIRKSVIETWTVNATTKPYTALNTSTTTVLTQNITALATHITGCSTPIPMFWKS